jgi:hypothetical protein
MVPFAGNALMAITLRQDQWEKPLAFRDQLAKFKTITLNSQNVRAH